MLFLSSPVLSASEQAMDHNQDRQTILSETQHRTCVLSKEILNLKDEKTKQVSHPSSALQTGQLESSAFFQCPIVPQRCLPASPHGCL